MSSAATAPAGLHKAAILMVILGEDAASQIYRHLPPAEVEQITHEIAVLKSVDAETALAVLEEFERLVTTGDYLAQGGKEYANKLLIKAFGEEGAKELLRQVAQTAEMSAGKLDSLRKADPQQLAKFIEGEHPQTIALILAHLEAKQASTLLMRLPEELRSEAVKRLAQLRQFSPEMAQRVSLVLHKRLEALGEQSRRAYAGLRGVADVMNRLDITNCQNYPRRHRERRSQAGAVHPQPDVHLRRPADRARSRHPRVAGADGQEDTGHGPARRLGRIEELHFQIDVVARRRNAERRYGSAGAGEVARESTKRRWRPSRWRASSKPKAN